MKAVFLAITLILVTPVLALAWGASETSEVASFSYDDVSRVVAENAQIFAIEVTGEAGRGLEAEVFSPRDSRVGIEHRRSGSTVIIRAYRKTGSPWIFGPRGEHMLVLRVPRNVELDLATGTGTIRVTGVDGVKTLNTDTGRLEVYDSRGDVVARNDTGSHVYTNLAGNLTARSGTGSITLEGAEGVLELVTDTGSIQGVDLRIRGDSRFETDTGNIILAIDQSLDLFSFDLRSDTGTIAVGDTESRARMVTGSGSLLVNARTDTGSIRIRGR